MVHRLPLIELVCGLLVKKNREENIRLGFKTSMFVYTQLKISRYRGDFVSFPRNTYRDSEKAVTNTETTSPGKILAILLTTNWIGLFVKALFHNKNPDKTKKASTAIFGIEIPNQRVAISWPRRAFE